MALYEMARVNRHIAYRQSLITDYRLLEESTMAESKLNIGDAAPDFKLRGVITKPDVKRVDVQLSDYRGEKNIVIAFHPFAFTAT